MGLAHFKFEYLKTRKCGNDNVKMWKRNVGI